jgi:hypothetical protein
LLLAGLGALLGAGLVAAVVLVRLDRPAPEQEKDTTVVRPAPEVSPSPGPSPAQLPPAPEETPHEKAVRLAIHKGSAYVKKRLLEGEVPAHAPGIPWPDTRIGAAALMGLALLESGAPANDLAVERALGIVRQNSDKMANVYVLGAALFFLNRLNEVGALGESDQRLVRRLALRLIAGQIPSGQWSYTNPPISSAAEKQLLEKLHKGKYRPTGAVAVYGSNSMTQFAVLSLWGARKCGVPVRAPLLKAAQQFHTTQLPDGAWQYNRRHGFINDSNTCAGLLALAIERALRYDKEFENDPTPLPPPHPKLDAIRRKGFVRLGKVIGQKKPAHNIYPGMGRMFGAAALGDCYFLWCLERVAVIYDLKLIEGKDWYRWGADALLAAQAQNGSWSDGYDPAIDTAFAILFLKRVNLAPDLTDKLQRLEQQGQGNGG